MGPEDSFPALSASFRLQCLVVAAGLVETAKVDSVRVYWPNGSTQTLTDVPVGRPG